MAVTNVPVPVCPPAGVVVAVRARPINPTDLLRLTGRHVFRPALPTAVGIEGAGVVVDAGRLRVGAAVAIPAGRSRRPPALRTGLGLVRFGVRLLAAHFVGERLVMLDHRLLSLARALEHFSI